MRTKAKMAAMAGLFLGAAALATPAAAQDSGFYLGMSAGRSKVKSLCDPIPGETILSCDDKGSAWKLFGGYQFTRHWGIEAGYVDLGKGTIATDLPAAVQVEGTAWQLVGTGTLPLSQQFDMFGKLGIYRGELDAHGKVLGVSASVSGRSTEWTYGLGARWNFSKNWSARIEWEKFDKFGNDTTGRADINLLSFGVSYRFQ